MINPIGQHLDEKINLGQINNREILVNFDGGNITSDAGIVLISELDKKLGITSSFAECFQDYRHQSYIDYPIERLLAQRVYAILLGYEDVNDQRRDEKSN